MSRVEAVKQALHAAHGVKGRSLSEALRKAGRLLPGRVHRAGAQLARVENSLGNPKLERMLDDTQLKAQQNLILEHLGTVDVTGNRTKRVMGLTANICLNVMIVVLAFVMWAVARGHM